jgi:hypothetical protein
MVQNKGPWNYKRQNMDCHELENFNDGAVALGFGFMEK